MKSTSVNPSQSQTNVSFENTKNTLKQAVNVCTPLIAIETQDPAVTIKWIMDLVKAKRNYFVWDVINGLRPAEDKRSLPVYDSFVRNVINQGEDSSDKEEIIGKTTNLPELLNLLKKCPDETIIFAHNVHRFLEFETVIQGLWNLRDIFKLNTCTFIMLGPSYSNVIPPELVNDIIIIEEELPPREIIKDIILSQFSFLSNNKNGKITTPDKEELERITNYLTGMSAFSVEQRLALSLRLTGLDYPVLAQQKKNSLSIIPGLTYEEWGETFNNIGGLDSIKEFLSRYMKGQLQPKVIVRLDEIEKTMGGIGGDGSQGDTSGVSQDALGVVLSNMEDQKWTGLLLVGVSGSGKSLISKALAGTYGVPLITQDLGAARGSLVGQSERNIRTQMKAIRGMAGSEIGGAFYIATCNKLNSIPVELKRRFKLGIWFFDLPTKEELQPIWDINLKKYNLSYSPLEEENLTGSDIHNICQIAYALNCSLEEAREYTVTVYNSDPEAVQKLRNLASGRFLSASYKGVYLEPSERLIHNQNKGRNIQF